MIIITETNLNTFFRLFLEEHKPYDKNITEPNKNTSAGSCWNSHRQAWPVGLHTQHRLQGPRPQIQGMRRRCQVS